MRKKNKRDVLILIILLFFFLSRLLVIKHGLPANPNLDEKDFIVRSLLMVRRLDFDPGWYGIPGGTLVYLLLPFYYLYFIIKSPVLQIFLQGGGIKTAYLVWESFFPNKIDVYIIARFVNIVISVLTVLVTYLLSKRIFKSKYIALISASLLGVSPLFFKFNIVARTDIIAILFYMLTSYFTVIFIEKRDLKILSIASVMAGLSIASRYHGLVAFLTLFIIVFLLELKTTIIINRSKRKSFLIFNEFILYIKRVITFDSYLSYVCLFSFFGFFIASPGTLINIRVALVNIFREAVGYSSAHDANNRLPGIQNYLWYVNTVLIKGTGSLVLLPFAILGIYKLVFLQDKISRNNLLIFMFPLIFYIFIAESKLRWDRWMMPVMPYFLMLVACGIEQSTEFLPKLKKYAIILSLFVICPLLYRNIMGVLLIIRRTNSNFTKEWLTSTNLKNADREVKFLVLGRDREAQRVLDNLDVKFNTATDFKNLSDEIKYLVVSDPTYLDCYQLPVFADGEEDFLCKEGIKRDGLFDFIDSNKEPIPVQFKLLKRINGYQMRGLPLDIYEKIE